MMATNRRGCRVTRCKEKHSKHYCRLCKEKDTNHFSSECPNSVTLYHGTHIKVTQPIADGGLKESGDGRLGPGVYFVEEYDEAKKISNYRRHKDDKRCTVVFKCQVYLCRHCNLGTGTGNSWQDDYDSASTMHPPWAKITYDFKEYCLKDSKHCVVRSILIDDKPIRKDKRFTWGDAQEEIRLLHPQASSDEVEQAMSQLKLK